MARRKRVHKQIKPSLSRQLFRSWLVVGLTLLSLLSAGAFWGVMRLQDPNNFPLRVVRIDGHFRHLQRVKLEQVISQAVKGNFFTVDLELIRKNASRVPWVESVSVRRIWPDTLHMQVVEQVPLLRWNQNSLLNTKGVRFTPSMEEIPNDLPHLVGPAGSEAEMFNWYQSIKPRFNKIGLEIALMRLDARRAWSITFSQGMEVRLGKNEVQSRLSRFLRLYPYLVQSKQLWIQRMDLRYTNGFAVYWSTPKERESGEATKEQAS